MIASSHERKVRPKPPPKPLGQVVYHGPSELDGETIVVLASETSKNVKTGNMIQIWILRADQKPTEAIMSGEDGSICGSCPLRGVLGKGRKCYVNAGHGPGSAYDAWHRGRYTDGFDPEMFRGRKTRLGAYGDPAAVPRGAIEAIVNASDGHTGYTHQWRQRRFSWLKRYVMASTETPGAKNRAKREGWSTFGIQAEPDEGETLCPSRAGVNCIDCMLCNGTDGGRRHITIPPHGGLFTMRAWAKKTE